MLSRFVHEHSWDLHPKDLRNVSLCQELGQAKRMLKRGLVLLS